MTTPEDRKRADAAVAELERAYKSGLVRIGFTPEAAALLLLLGPAAALAGTMLFKSSQQLSVEKAFRDMQPQLQKWKSTYRAWADAGKRDDGSAYTWERWSQVGRELGDAIAYHTGESWNASILVGWSRAVVATGADVVTVAKKTVQTAADIANVPAWTTTTKVVIGLTAAAVILVIALPYVTTLGQAVRAVKA